MRIAHVLTRLILGGAQENTLWTVDDLHHRHGDEVCLITGPGLGPEGSLEQRARERGLDIQLIPELRRNLHPLRDYQAYRAIVRALRAYAPDIVHTHSSKAGILGRRAAKVLGIPVVHTIHGAAFHYGQSVPAWHVYRLAEKVAAGWTDHIISVCDAMTEQYLQAGVGRREQYTTIYSGMDVDRFLQPKYSRSDLRKRIGVDEETVVVVKVARLFHLKGHNHLIEAAPQICERVPGIRFVLVGDGILQQDYEQRVAELGLAEHITFTGLVPPDEVGAWIAASDLLVHTSEWEGLARVLPQALIAGRPVVSFDIDGAPEVCLPGETGLLVPRGDHQALAEAIAEMAGDREKRESWGENGRRRFTEVFRHETMTAQIRLVYEQVLATGSR